MRLRRRPLASSTSELLALETATALSSAEKGNYEAFLVGWPGFVDPDMNIYSMLACRAPLNYSGYCNPEVDQLLNAARAPPPSTVTVRPRASDLGCA